MLSKITCGFDIGRGEFLLCLATNAPNIFNAEKLECLLSFFFGVNDTYSIVRRVLFGKFAGDFGEGFCGCNTDRNGYSDPLSHLADNLFVVGFEFGDWHVVGMQEGLVHGVLFEARGVLSENTHDTAGEVAIKRKIGRKSGDLVQFGKSFDLEEGHAHLDAELFGFVTTRYDTAIVAR